jgi:inosine-uridine nucleoside N-ribohydrolase
MVRLIHYWELTVAQYPATPVWDAAAAALAIDPSIGTDWQDLAIRIETEPEDRAGQTFIEPGKPANARVCFGGDQAAFENAYLKVAQTTGR